MLTMTFVVLNSLFFQPILGVDFNIFSVLFNIFSVLFNIFAVLFNIFSVLFNIFAVQFNIFVLNTETKTKTTNCLFTSQLSCHVCFAHFRNDSV